MEKQTIPKNVTKLIGFMVFNATFNNISVISCRFTKLITWYTYWGQIKNALQFELKFGFMDH